MRSHSKSEVYAHSQGLFLNPSLKKLIKIRILCTFFTVIFAAIKKNLYIH